MSFSPSTFYSVACDLRLQSFSDGGYLRTLISRAYYGALIVARDARNLSTLGEGGHLGVIDAYRGDADDCVIADALFDLKKLRVKADYRPDINLGKSEADLALALSKKVLLKLNAMPPRTGSDKVH